MDNTAARLLNEPLGFGRVFTPRIFTQRYAPGKGWHDAAIVPRTALTLDAAAQIFHSGQNIFEGTKAYARADGDVNLFRIEKNMQRFNASARRMGMPEIDVQVHIDAIVELVKLECEWIPRREGASLYIRPVMVGTESTLQVRASESYLHYVLLSPVGPYFGGDLQAVAVHVECDCVRAVAGGTGEAKTSANYAGTLAATQRARALGYFQVLWLDALERRFVEELGAMNVAFVYEEKHIITPALSGSILHGVTRDSLLTLAPDLGLSMSEERIDIDRLLRDIEQGLVTEAFAMGTGAVIAPIGRLGFRDRDYLVNDGQIGPIGRRLYQVLTDIQYGRTADRYGWTRTLELAKTKG